MKGDPPDKFYIIFKGSVIILAPKDRQELEIDIKKYLDIEKRKKIIK